MDIWCSGVAFGKQDEQYARVPSCSLTFAVVCCMYCLLLLCYETFLKMILGQ